MAAEPVRRDDPERRQLTVMFTGLVGSTALLTKLDAEDMRPVIGAYHKCVAETVARFDGFVAKYMGDGVLVYFSYPHAHEDDAERAVRAGLVLIETVGKLRFQEPLQVHIGVATGLVVVGDQRASVPDPTKITGGAPVTPRIRWATGHLENRFHRTAAPAVERINRALEKMQAVPPIPPAEPPAWWREQRREPLEISLGRASRFA